MLLLECHNFYYLHFSGMSFNVRYPGAILSLVAHGPSDEEVQPVRGVRGGLGGAELLTTLGTKRFVLDPGSAGGLVQGTARPDFGNAVHDTEQGRTAMVGVISPLSSAVLERDDRFGSLSTSLSVNCHSCHGQLCSSHCAVVGARTDRRPSSVAIRLVRGTRTRRGYVLANCAHKALTRQAVIIQSALVQMAVATSLSQPQPPSS